MDTRIVAGGSRSDVVTTDSAPRVTPPSGIPFRDMVSRGATAVLSGAEAAVTSLPGAPIVAAAVRGGSATSGAGLSIPKGGAFGLTGPHVASLPAVDGSAESPTSPAAGVSPAAESSSVEGTLAQSQEFNLYYLQLQEQLAAENRAYSAMSNVLKARHDTVKNAIGNIR
jgi:hypothetical protein